MKPTAIVADRAIMTPRRAFIALLALGAVIVAAAVFAMSGYHDDAREQAWQFEVGTQIVRVGLPVLIGAGIITIIWALRDDR
jgi:hypothetical protein